MTKMSNLPRDLAEEVLSKVPVTSLRRVRSTCRSGKLYPNIRVLLHLGEARLATSREFTVVILGFI